MFREIRRSERITEQDIEDMRKKAERERLNREYLKIRPVNDTTVDDCNAFWNSIFEG